RGAGGRHRERRRRRGARGPRHHRGGLARGPRDPGRALPSLSSVPLRHEPGLARAQAGRGRRGLVEPATVTAPLVRGPKNATSAKSAKEAKSPFVASLALFALIAFSGPLTRERPIREARRLICHGAP